MPDDYKLEKWNVVRVWCPTFGPHTTSIAFAFAPIAIGIFSSIPIRHIHGAPGRLLWWSKISN
jgi:hypothetical protein